MTTTAPITKARAALNHDRSPAELRSTLRALIEHAEKLQAERDAAIKNRDEWASRMMECVTHVGASRCGCVLPA